MRQPTSTPPSADPTRARRIVAGAVALLAFLAIAITILKGGLPIFGSGKPSAVIQPTVTATPLDLSPYDRLTSIDMRSPSEGWAVGTSGLDQHFILLHYAHHTWMVAPVPTLGIAPSVIRMVSADEGWIAGGSRDNHGMMLHGVGGHWTSQPLPAGTGTIVSLAMVSPAEGWAMDTTNAEQQQGHILHYSQGVWSVAVTLPGRSTAASIAMTSTSEGWATSVDQSSGESATTLWHYEQGTWQPIAIHDPQQADIEYISMLSSDDGWAIGSFPLPHHQGDQYQRQGGAIWRYAGGQWQVVQRIIDDPAQAIALSALQATAPDEVWAYETDSVGRRFLHGVGGVWQTVSVPKPTVIYAMAMVSTNEGWAVGEGGVILHYTGGRWTDYFAR